MVLFPKRVRDALGRAEKPGVTINQITWQVGSMREVGNAIKWFNEAASSSSAPAATCRARTGTPISRSRRPQQRALLRHRADRLERPQQAARMYDRGFDKPPELPQISEFEEVEQARAKGIDQAAVIVMSTICRRPTTSMAFCCRGHSKSSASVRSICFVDDMDTAADVLSRRLGFTLTEEVNWQGQRCLFFRCNTEHHSLALFPTALREPLGLSPPYQERRLRPSARELSSAQRRGEIFPRARL